MTNPLAALVSLGDPRLRRANMPVLDPTDRMFVEARETLHEALAAFRLEHGFGRAIAAPQLNDPRRYIAMNLGDGPFTLHNPIIVWRDKETFTLWDDCMSFPDLLVRVERHRSITVQYLDEHGHECILEKVDPALSELLQHEIDHLDGVLAVDRALDKDALVTRRAFDANPDYYRSMVDTL